MATRLTVTTMWIYQKFEDTKGYSKAINWRMTDNTVTKEKDQQWAAMSCNTSQHTENLLYTRTIYNHRWTLHTLHTTYTSSTCNFSLISSSVSPHNLSSLIRPSCCSKALYSVKSIIPLMSSVCGLYRVLRENCRLCDSCLRKK